jgi:YbbR domain-containing protein
VIPFRQPNIPIALLALFLSVGLWIHVESQADRAPQSNFIDVPLSLQNLDRTQWSADAPRTIKAQVSGDPDSIRALANSSQLMATVDLTAVQRGRTAYPVVLTNPDPRVQVTPLNRRVLISIERIIRRAFTVTVETRGQLPIPSLTYSESLVSPEKIVLIGSESEIERVKKVRAMLDLANVEPQKDYSIVVEPLDERDRPIPGIEMDPPSVFVRPALMAKPQEKAVLINPNFQGHVAYGYRVTGYEMDPNQVFIRGSSINISRITSVETRPISIEGLKQSTVLSAPLALPEGITLAKDRAISVRVIIEPVPGLPGDNANGTSTTGGQ